MAHGDPFWRKIWPDGRAVFLRVYDQVSDHNLSLMAAGIAFFAMLALFPGLAALISVYGMLADPLVFEEVLQKLQPIVPGDIFGIIDHQVRVLIATRNEHLGLVSALNLLLATWSARAGMTAMVTGLNVIFHETGSRGYWRDLLVAYFLTILLIIIAMISLSTVVILPTIIGYLPLGNHRVEVVEATSIAVGVVTVLVGIGGLYRLAPNRRRNRLAWVTPGSIVAAVLWVAASLLLSVYLNNFARFNAIYGTLGTVIALLLWIYFSAYVVLLGAELNAAVERQFHAKKTGAS